MHPTLLYQSSNREGQKLSDRNFQRNTYIVVLLPLLCFRRMCHLVPKGYLCATLTNQKILLQYNWMQDILKRSNFHDMLASTGSALDKVFSTLEWEETHTKLMLRLVALANKHAQLATQTASGCACPSSSPSDRQQISEGHIPCPNLYCAFKQVESCSWRRHKFPDWDGWSSEAAGSSTLDSTTASGQSRHAYLPASRGLCLDRWEILLWMATIAGRDACACHVHQDMPKPESSAVPGGWQALSKSGYVSPSPNVVVVFRSMGSAEWFCDSSTQSQA